MEEELLGKLAETAAPEVAAAAQATENLFAEVMGAGSSTKTTTASLLSTAGEQQLHLYATESYARPIAMQVRQSAAAPFFMRWAAGSGNTPADQIEQIESMMAQSNSFEGAVLGGAIRMFQPVENGAFRVVPAVNELLPVRLPKALPIGILGSVGTIGYRGADGIVVLSREGGFVNTLHPEYPVVFGSVQPTDWLREARMTQAAERILIKGKTPALVVNVFHGGGYFVGRELDMLGEAQLASPGKMPGVLIADSGRTTGARAVDAAFLARYPDMLVTTADKFGETLRNLGMFDKPVHTGITIPKA